MSSIPIKPSRWYYVISLLALIGGCSLFTLFLFKSFRVPNALVQIVVPGQWDITLAKPGNYTVFYEYKSIVQNKVYATDESLSGLKCVVTSNTTGKSVALTPAYFFLKYSVESKAGIRTGLSAFNFSIKQPGTYEFSCGYSQGKEGSEIVLAIGQNFTGKVFEGLAIFFGSGAIAISIAVVTFLRRRKAKQRQGVAKRS